MRKILFWAATAGMYGACGLMIAQKEQLFRDGQTVYLVLAPVDPRSPFQGDYMALNYKLANDMNHLPGAMNGGVASTGLAVMTLDAAGKGKFARIYNGESLAPNEHLLKYHHDGWQVVIGAEHYFIPEGSGGRFAKATYGELKVAADGTPLLIALCDQQLQAIPRMPPAKT